MQEGLTRAKYRMSAPLERTRSVHVCLWEAVYPVRVFGDRACV